MASPMHCLGCDCRAKSQQQPTPSAYGCQSRMMSQTPYRQKGHIMRYRKTLLLIRHSYSNGNVNGTCTTSSYGLRLLHQPLWQHRFHQRHNPCLHPSLPSRVSHTHHRQLTMIPALRPCKRVVRFSRLSRHSLSCYLRLQISGLHKNTISHCRTGLLITVLRLLDSNQIECEDGTSLWADVSATPARILVPTSLQRIVFDSLHRIAHPGLKAGLMLIKRSYWWQGISKYVARWTKSCAACQKAKIHVHTKMPLERLPAPTKRFSHIHIDLVGPLNPPCEGKNTLLTIIDRWTGWPEAFPMTMHGDAANAKACAKVLVREWLSRWGVPDIMTSDRGSQFVNWLSELPWVMLGLRAASNLDTGVSPSILVTGQQPTLPGQLVVQRPTIDDASDFCRKLASAMAAQTFHENPWHEKRRGHSYAHFGYYDVGRSASVCS